MSQDSKTKDPFGINQHDPGAKLDSGKNRIGLVLGGFARALKAVGWVGTFGANKYSPNGWKSVPNGIERYTDALGRHLLDEAEGKLIDDDSNLLHAAHAAWNALARLELILKDLDAEPKVTLYTSSANSSKSSNSYSLNEVIEVDKDGHEIR